MRAPPPPPAKAAAEAARDHARTEYERINRLCQQQNAARTECDAADTALKAAKAELQRAEQARTVPEYATIRSPIDGIVIDKKIEAGDTAQPERVLLNLYDPTRMQLVASVRESLTQRLKPGQAVRVRIDALNMVCDEARISGVVPEAESASRTFAVKVTGPCPPGVCSGMFGRLLIPLDVEEVLVIPRSAVRRVGQPGREFGEEAQVLSGLRVGEQVAVARGATPAIDAAVITP